MVTTKVIVASLLAWIGAHTNYTVPAGAPMVALVPHAFIAELACAEECPALGVYPDGNVVYIDQDLQIDTNVCAQSVLLHELVHYLQDRDGRFLNVPPAIRSRLREHEAYAVQQAYLASNGRKVAFGPSFYIGAFMGPSC
ncbi:MAG TPA: DUF6647 family protein [Alphaproteobacteria bacterium]|nr:DUF6647 family protein [Alphaproteobacteria bacterium]